MDDEELPTYEFTAIDFTISESYGIKIYNGITYILKGGIYIGYKSFEFLYKKL